VEDIKLQITELNIDIKFTIQVTSPA